MRQKVKDIPSQSRTATGFTVQKVDPDSGDRISSISILPRVVEEKGGNNDDA